MDGSVEHPFASALCAVAGILGDVGDQTRIENAFPIVCGIKATIKVEISASQIYINEGVTLLGNEDWGEGRSGTFVGRKRLWSMRMQEARLAPRATGAYLAHAFRGRIQRRPVCSPASASLQEKGGPQ